MANGATNNVHAIEFISPSGKDIIDGIQFGFKYAADDDGTYNVTFSIPGEGAVFNDTYLINDVDVAPGFFPVTEEAANWFRDGAEFASRISGITIKEIEENGDIFGEIRFAATTDIDPPLGAMTFGNINVFDLNQTGDIFVDDRAFTDDFHGLHRLVIHELGHALGLAHPGDGFGGAVLLPGSVNGDEYTIMDTNFKSMLFTNATWADLYPTTFMYVDILALQGLYGEVSESNSGDNTYTFDLSKRHFETLYDLGGNDTLVVSGTSGSKATDSASINLKETDQFGGRFIDVGSEIRYMNDSDQVVGTNSKTVYVSPETIIENVATAAGDDLIAGNNADNSFSSGDGNDTMNGGAGDDTLDGGNGDDALWAGTGDEGNDLSLGGSGLDTLGGGLGNDTLVGGSDSDLIFGGAGNDVIALGNWQSNAASTVDSANNTAWAGDGDDTVFGDCGDDAMGGGLGHDSISGNAGNDTIYAGKSGNDTLSGGSGNDTIYGGTNNDQVSGDTGNDELYGGSGTDTVSGGNGDDTLYGGNDADTLTGGEGDDYLHGGGGEDMFIFTAGHGEDTVDGFDTQSDTLDLSGTTTDFTDVASVSAASTDTAINGTAGLLIDTGGEDTIFLAGLSVADINSLNFSF